MHRKLKSSAMIAAAIVFAALAEGSANIALAQDMQRDQQRLRTMQQSGSADQLMQRTRKRERKREHAMNGAARENMMMNGSGSMMRRRQGGGMRRGR